MVAIMIKRTSDGNVVKKENLSWTNKRDNALIEALVNKHEIGNRVNGTSTLEANPNAEAFKTKKISNYNNLDIIGIKSRNNKTEKTPNYANPYKLKKNDVDELITNIEVILDNKYKDNDEYIQIMSATHFKTKKLKSKRLKLENYKKNQDEDEGVVEPVNLNQNLLNTILYIYLKKIVDVMKKKKAYHDYKGKKSINN
uniref:Uncharacterized protein n=1 Tax=Lactuca sativa TaxID=4236 RepID=A0A9R1UV51_LACSA|nr:hypothetical protein LSAT_V11C800417580 [Lactuca sativa]